MKRCSQCDFVYEDDQGLCDMDGGELVYEPTLYPPAGLATTKSNASPLKFRSRSFLLTAAATIAMGLFLAIGFYGFTNRSRHSTSVGASGQPGILVQPAMAATPPAGGASAAESSAVDAKSASVSSGQPSAAAKTSPSVTRSTTTREVKKPVPSKSNRQEDSKVGSLLKKTGRILKKPFKL